MSHCLNNRWISGAGEPLASIDPATGQGVWQGRSATVSEVDAAVLSARQAFPGWSDLAVEQRISYLHSMADRLKSAHEKLAETISREMGKPKWESLTEVEAMIGKIPLSIQAYQERRRPIERDVADIHQATRFKPHGVVAVLGPFNFPGHLPHGHIVPALLAGNTIVCKPSELTPFVGETIMQLWLDAGLPAGVLNLVQGGRDTGIALAGHRRIDGLFFTGSANAGASLNRLLEGNIGKILALELGGNNPLIVWDAPDTAAAVYHTIQSAFLTSGQRCSCARRLILNDDPFSDEFLSRLTNLSQQIKVAPWTDRPEPFMGPVINDMAARRLLDAQYDLHARGGKILLEMKSLGNRPALLSPGIMDVTAVADREDRELFGPFLQVIRVKTFDEAIDEANNTSFGLAAGLLSDNRSLYERFFKRIRAGVVNWNRPTTGAGSALPFGGIGLSGNHRPSGYYAADYCSYPIASLEESQLKLPSVLPPGIVP